MRIQQEALEKFLSFRSNIFTGILNGTIESPTEDKECKFVSQSFNTVAKNNRQPEAVRKAIDNKNVMLTQGPPGTGKTCTIVEIVCQLALRGRRVLVCSQSNAAVDNIRKRLEDLSIGERNLTIARIGRENATEAWGLNYDKEAYTKFLQDSRTLALAINSKGEGGATDSLKKPEYAGHTDFTKSLDHMTEYPQMLQALDKKVIEECYTELLTSDEFLRARGDERLYLESKDVILGTCIGIGMNNAVQEMHFDTVIIDEAAKANLAESLVPLGLGDRWVLVGDDNQLPPYVDREQIAEYVGQKGATDSTTDGENTENLKEADAVAMQSLSLFEFLHDLLPEDNVVMLNYQYRMHPDIARCISDLFYGGDLRNGITAEDRLLDLQDFPKAVTFVDTSDRGRQAWEQKEGSSYKNDAEVDLIVRSILKSIDAAKMADVKVSDYLGIITPYSAQSKAIINHPDFPSRYKECVHTIDSIQGSEFDVVIFSFVRAFPYSSHKNVGFLDDMRRLNVSLSRAKRKLILVGNLDTLTREKVHAHFVRSERFKGASPVDVFNKMAKFCQTWHKPSAKEELMKFLKDKGEGYTLYNCRCTYQNKPIIDFTYKWGEKLTKWSCRDKDGVAKSAGYPEKMDMRYSGLDSNGIPQFEPQIAGTATTSKKTRKR